MVMGLAVALTGCLTGRGVHTVPVERDYANLEKVQIEDAEPVVKEAHRKGAHHFAPYEYSSAAKYYKYAVGARAEGDRKGEKDYAKLAIDFANQAIANGSGIEDKGELGMPDNIDGARAEYDRILKRYTDLNHCKAKVVAPHIFAHLEANLAQAEHEINERCHYPEGIRHLRLVEPDIDAILAMDFDGDGVTDMEDGEPWIPEDADGFQDGDGMPEPKPYPVLDPVLFDTDKAIIKPEARGYLRGIADMLNDGYKEATLVLSAHTDAQSSDEYNQKLSQRREDAVKSFLVAEGVDAARVKASHHGEATPVADNNTAAGRQQNRRCELSLDSPDPVSPYCN